MEQGICRIAVPIFAAAIKSESWSKYLKSLEKFILPMNFWEADDVVVLGKPFDVDVFSFPGGLRRKMRSPLVFQVTHRRPPSGIWTHVFLS